MSAFPGATFDTARDADRLLAQQAAVNALMEDGQWRTLRDVAQALGYPEASVSARFRCARKPKHGGFLVDREYVERGLFRYRYRRPA